VKNDSLAPQANEDGPAGSASKNILILEDETALSETLAPFFETNGFSVACVTNGVDGLRQIMARDFAVIVCDMMMPNLPGDMFYRAVERTKPHLCKRFIFITGYKGNREIEDFIRKVKGVMLWKPFETSELMETINSVMRTSAGD
jgi:DNA-binding response OmpR family regulator